jgi:hypothetical protein
VSKVVRWRPGVAKGGSELVGRQMGPELKAVVSQAIERKQDLFA